MSRYLLPEEAAERGLFGVGVIRCEDEPDCVRIVFRFCDACQRALAAHHFSPMAELDDVMIVSPAGVAHAQRDDGYAWTMCGKSGAARDWWWRT